MDPAICAVTLSSIFGGLAFLCLTYACCHDRFNCNRISIAPTGVFITNEEYEILKKYIEKPPVYGETNEPPIYTEPALITHEPTSHEPTSHEPTSHEPTSHEPTSHEPTLY
jgi:hypothetical protein